MGSNAITDINQGGGSKKAGFPYMIGRDSWASIFIQGCDPVGKHCCTLTDLKKTLVFTKNTVRPVGNDARIPMR
jgi:hypothetical protein